MVCTKHEVVLVSCFVPFDSTEDFQVYSSAIVQDLGSAIVQDLGSAIVNILRSLNAYPQQSCVYIVYSAG